MKFRLDRKLLFSRGENDDPRLGDVVQTPSPRDFEKEDWDIVLIGFPDDRGVALNQGRAGAAEGPGAIRRWFYRLVPPEPRGRIADLGDLVMSASLEKDHAAAVEAVALGLSRARRVAVLGGGHDWGYAPIAALMQSGRTGFINLDAHLDVRPSPVPHSGTAFWRALEGGVRGEDALWFGVQSASASRTHVEYVAAKGGTILFADPCSSPEVSVSRQQSGEGVVKRAAVLFGACENVDVSLDMDVFRMSAAPGVSAPQPLGLEPDVVAEALSALLKEPKVRTFGIYELSPPHDVQDMTARLAARCLWEAVRT